MRHRTICALLLLGALLLATTASAGAVPAFYVGANAVWFDNETMPSDFEIGGAARASLSPHISAIGNAFYGVDNSYLIGQIGARVTATDVENKDFSVGVGFAYQASSKVAVRPEEWVGQVAIGYRPWPAEMPKVVIGAGADYGLTTTQAAVKVALRYEIGGAN